MYVKYGRLLSTLTTKLADRYSRQNARGRAASLRGTSRPGRSTGLLVVRHTSQPDHRHRRDKDAYAIQNKTLGLYFDANTANGLHVLTPGRRRNRQRHGSQFSRGAEGPSIPLATAGPIKSAANWNRWPTTHTGDLVSWDETLSFHGNGGPEFVLMQPLNGLPQRWEVADATPYYVTQEGGPSGAIAYPSMPPPSGPKPSCA